MELAEFATLALVAGTVTYRTMRLWQSTHQNRKSCDDERSLTLAFTFDHTAGVPEEQASLLAFNSAYVWCLLPIWRFYTEVDCFVWRFP